MELQEFAQQVRILAQKALHIHEQHGHAERLEQTTNALVTIEQLAAEHTGKEDSEPTSVKKRGGE